MGLAGVNPMSLLLILVIALLLFGTNRIKHIGRDLGEAIKEFRAAMAEDEPARKKDDEKNESEAMNNLK